MGPGFSFERRFGSNAGAIPGTENPERFIRMKRWQSFLIRSWVDLPHVWNASGSIAFHFQDYPKLLLSATHLVTLYLYNIPYSGFMSPETMATTLSVLTRLEFLSLEFQSPRSHLDRASRHPPPLTRSVLSSLALFGFEGVCEYLDDLVARIDAPICSL